MLGISQMRYQKPPNGMIKKHDATQNDNRTNG